MVVEIKKVGVIGAGQMGNGIAHVCAVAGFDVWLNDISVDRVQSGLASINGNMARQVAKGLITEDERTAALDRLKPAESMDELADVDLVIESAVENEQIKRKIFAIDPHTLIWGSIACRELWMWSDESGNGLGLDVTMKE